MKRYRVECNFGCKYYRSLDKALDYFNKCKAKHLDCEIWVVFYSIGHSGKFSNARQDLLYSYGSCLVKM